MNDRERIAILEEQVAELASLLGLTLSTERTAALQRRYGLRPQSAKLLQVLLKRDVVTRELALRALARPGDDDYPGRRLIDVLIVDLRKHLAPLDVEIETVWGQGWRIDPAHRAMLQDDLPA